MNLDDLRSAQVDERGTDSLQPLRPSFYEEAAAYLADLRERRDQLAEAVDDPFDSEEVRQLTDELETAEEVVESIYDRRVGKLVKQASLAAAGMSANEDGLTEEERALYGDLVERIEANRETVLDALDGEAAVEPASTRADPEPPADTPEGADEGSLDAAEAMGTEAAAADTDDVPTESDADQSPEPDGGSTTTPSEAETADRTPDDDRLTVRITDAVGEIYGVDDRVYTLDAEDVVTLPEANAKPLLERGAAQRVD